MKHAAALPLVLLAAAAAHAAPFTTLLGGLRDALSARLAALDGQTDALSRKRAAGLKAAIRTIDKEKSRSVADDLRTLGKVAAKIEAAFVPNDEDLVAALGGFQTRVETDLANVDAEIAQVLSAKVHDAAAERAQDAQSDFATAIDPQPGDTARSRAALLRSAEKKVAAARRKLRGDGVCSGAGAVLLVFDGQQVRFPSTTAEIVHDDGGGVTGISFSVSDEESGAALSFFTTTPFDLTPDTYTVGDGVGEQATLTYTDGVAGYESIDGTFTITSADTRKGAYTGTMSVTFARPSVPGSDVAATLRFRICRSRRPPQPL